MSPTKWRNYTEKREDILDEPPTDFSDYIHPSGATSNLYNMLVLTGWAPAKAAVEVTRIWLERHGSQGTSYSSLSLSKFDTPEYFSRFYSGISIPADEPEPRLPLDFDTIFKHLPFDTGTSTDEATS